MLDKKTLNQFMYTCTGMGIPNLSLMWPAKPKELPTPALHGSVLLIVVIVIGFRFLDSMTGNIETNSFSAVDFINVLRVCFLYKILAPKNTGALRSFSRYVLAKKAHSYKK
jgi:hypothetical protein